MTTAQVLIFFYHSLLPPSLGVLLYHLSPCVCINGHFTTCDIKWVRKKSFLHLKKEVNWCFVYKMLWFFCFPFMTLKQIIKVHGSCFGFNTLVLVTHFNRLRWGTCAMMTGMALRMLDIGIFIQKNNYNFWIQYCTPHTFQFYIYIFLMSITKEQCQMSKFEVLWRLGQDTTQWLIFFSNFTFLTTWNNSFL